MALAHCQQPIWDGWRLRPFRTSRREEGSLERMFERFAPIMRPLPFSRLRSFGSLGRRLLLGAPLLLAGLPAAAQPLHTDPINLDPRVREAQTHFYNLDYEGALTRFEAIQREHPDNAMAVGYVLTIVIFRELYNQDLLDTKYYAHDSFLSTKREVNAPAATRQRIEDLTNRAIALSDQQLKANPQDANAYFERGYARGLHAAFITLADHSFAAAARQGYAARNDSEQALRIDPDYADAKMAIGI